MKRVNLMGAIFALLACSVFVMGQTVQLSTGFDNTLTVQNLYPNPPVLSNQPDSYWINIASSPNTPAGPAWVLHSPQASWWPSLLPASRWISAWKTAASQPGTTDSKPAYTIFRKCFCLQKGYQKASLSFQVRADDNINAYLNTTLNQVLPPASGQWNSPVPLQSLPSNPAWFRPGKNCLYVYLEDAGGFMGFDLAGSVTALGLLPTPAIGTNGSFEPCACNTGPVDQSGGPRTAREASVDEEQVVKEIINIAEARRNRKRN